MKKLVVLILFMFMASVATAALSLEMVGGSITDGAVTWTVSGMSIIGTGSVAGGSWSGSIGPADYVTGTFLNSQAATTSDAGNLRAHYQDAYGGVSFDAAGAIPPGEPELPDDLPNIGVWFTLSLDGVGLQDGDSIDFVLFNNSNGWFPSTGSGTINVVPEPMTMALLGLGGLFLRRKK